MAKFILHADYKVRFKKLIRAYENYVALNLFMILIY